MNINEAIKKIYNLYPKDIPYYLMCVGLPGSGKSTFIKKYISETKENIHVASTDDLLELEAAKLNINYSEAFLITSQKILKHIMEDEIKKSLSENKIVFHDQTNMSKKSRRSKLAAIPESYKKICLIFNIDDKILLSRLNERTIKTGKNIPLHVIKNMNDSYQVPTKDEGFDFIFKINNN